MKLKLGAMALLTLLAFAYQAFGARPVDNGGSGDIPRRCFICDSFGKCYLVPCRAATE